MTSGSTVLDARRQAHAYRQKLHTPLQTDGDVCSVYTNDLQGDEREDYVCKRIDLQELMAHELRDVTFEGAWVREALCPVRDDIHKRIFHELNEEAYTRNPDTNDFVLTCMPGPTETGEKEFTRAFVTLFNSVLEKLKAISPSTYQSSIFCGTSISVYGKSVLGSVRGEVSLKPGFVLAEHWSEIATQRISWYEALLVGESKPSWRRLISQLAIYARCLFAATDHRVFIPTLAFNNTDLTFRLCFFHHGGILATTPMLLSSEAGFQEFVSTVVGLWQWDTLQAAGYQPSQSQSHFSFNHACYPITEVLYRRPVIHGRATTIYVVEAEDRPGNLVTPSQHSSPELDPTPRPAKRLRNEVWYRLNPYSDLGPARPSTTIGLGPLILPDKFIIKCSYQPPERDKEEDIFGSVQGYIGIPELIGAYDAGQLVIMPDFEPVIWDAFKRQPNEVEDDYEGEYYSEECETSYGEGRQEASSSSWNKAEKLECAHSMGKQPRFENRCHRHLIIKTVGRHLGPDLGPKKVVRALQDAVIGHCALFTQGRYLHRDVSNGNIIYLCTPEQRMIPHALTTVLQNNECIAVLIDGDVATKWGGNEPSLHRSGTLPFLSTNIAENWSAGEPVLHTPIDDLESFIWVLLYDLLHWSPKLTRIERGWWRELNSNSIDVVARLKEAIAPKWRDPNSHKKFKLSRNLHNFRNLLHEWFVVVDRYASRCASLLEERSDSNEELDKLFVEAYVEFIKVAQKHIPLLPERFLACRPNQRV